MPSYHHQAADELGRELRAVAWSPDGVVEGIEAINRGFVIGVQWHAEGEGRENGRLFRSFVKAAQRHDSGEGRTGSRSRPNRGKTRLVASWCRVSVAP